jgi:hypothetical protein
VTANGPSERSLLRLFKMGERVNGEGEGTVAGLKARRGYDRGHDVPPDGRCYTPPATRWLGSVIGRARGAVGCGSEWARTSWARLAS